MAARPLPSAQRAAACTSLLVGAVLWEGPCRAPAASGGPRLGPARSAAVGAAAACPLPVGLLLSSPPA
eukprot:13800997-Alexandrium_andersonii.AAC.1